MEGQPSRIIERAELRGLERSGQARIVPIRLFEAAGRASAATDADIGGSFHY